MENFFDPHFVFTWVERFKKVHSQHCSILLGLGQPPSHMCGLGRYGVQLAVGVSFLFEVANIFQPHVVEVVVVASLLAQEASTAATPAQGQARPLTQQQQRTTA